MDYNEWTIQDSARLIVFNYVNEYLDVTDNFVLNIDMVFVVWFSKTLQNWKVVLCTTLPDSMYYEVTHNGDKKESYLEAYKKFDNLVISD